MVVAALAHFQHERGYGRGCGYGFGLACS